MIYIVIAVVVVIQVLLNIAFYLALSQGLSRDELLAAKHDEAMAKLAARIVEIEQAAVEAAPKRAYNRRPR